MTDAEQPLIGHKLIGDEPEYVRSGFIVKVYSLLSVQLALTTVVASPFVLVASVKAFVKTQGFPLVVGITILNILFLCLLMCPCCSFGGQDNLRTHPTNLILLGGFTVCEGMLVGILCSFYTLTSILFAVGATVLLVGGLTCYAMVTKKDFTGYGPYLFAACICLMIFGIFTMFFPFPFMHKVYCCFGIMLFSFYLIYDTQLIMGKGELRIGVDDYVFATLMLYLDIIQLFLYILQLFGDRN